MKQLLWPGPVAQYTFLQLQCSKVAKLDIVWNHHLASRESGRAQLLEPAARTPRVVEETQYSPRGIFTSWWKWNGQQDP
jgi:hypothetical protein